MRLAQALSAPLTLVAACGAPNNDPPAAPNAIDQAARRTTSAGGREDPGAAAVQKKIATIQLAQAPSEVIIPCLMQEGRRLEHPALRAIGTEPFWGARIEGRCVTYTHPENQDGTRIWTRYSASPSGGTWSGELGGRRFELRTFARSGCSDGMSDRSYPIAVRLIVGQEQQAGCADAG